MRKKIKKLCPIVNSNKLVKEFCQIREKHRDSVREHEARTVLGSSVIRVFEKDTKKGLIQALLKIPVDKLKDMRSKKEYEKWFEAQLERVARAILVKNRKNQHVNPGYKWGHAAKVLTIYIRGIVINSRYFDEDTVKRVSPWLFAPVDRIVLKRLHKLKCRFGFSGIKNIETRDDFYLLQNTLEDAAKKARVPRVWFDDNWASR